MIVLKILLWILLAIVALILLILIIPVGVKVGYVDKKFIFKVKLGFINMFELGGKGLLNRLMNRGKKKKKKKNEKPPTDAASDAAGETAPVQADEDKPAQENTAAETVQETASAQVTQQADASVQNEENAADAAADVNENAADESENASADDAGESNGEEPEKKKGKSLGEKIDFFHDIWHAAGRPALKIFKGFKFSDFYIDFLIANEDAYKCAMNYGRISAVLFYVLKWFSVLFNMKYRTVDVNAGFGQEKSRWDVSFKLSFKLLTVVIAGLWFLVTYIFKIFIPARRMKKKMKKRKAAMQK